MRATNDQTPATSALVIYRPLVEKTIAALGALVTHQLAYLAASLVGVGWTATGDHQYLSLQWAIVAPAAVIGAAIFVVWQLRWLGFCSAIPARQLATLVTGFFLAQELIEGLAGGHSLAELPAHPTIIAGIIIGPVVGWAMARLLAGVTELAARLLTSPSFLLPTVVLQPIAIPVRRSSTTAGSPSRPRAPPFALRI